MERQAAITQIDDGISVQPRHAPYTMSPEAFLQRKRVYPFYSLEVGQSFLVPVKITADTRYIRTRRTTLASMASRVKKRLGWEFATRFVALEHGIRVWRTA